MLYPQALFCYTHPALTNSPLAHAPQTQTNLTPLHWLILGGAVITAVFLRLYQLGDWPPGLYRDEAYNGLDALNVLNGHHTLFFAANNGREPAYIYLTAGLVGLFGPTVWAVRLGAALIGSLTIFPIFLLGRSWFGLRVGLLVAWLWAITLWPIHLSRIGLRAVLLIPCLTLTFWLGTMAYRRGQPAYWLLAGLVYGLSFYTYLAVRLTPLILLGIALYLIITRRPQRHHLLTGAGWFGVGTAVSLSPLLILYSQQPDLILGRTGQVSILNEAIHQGHLLATLWRHTWLGLGLFIGEGDTILRHNPAGRPVFDWLLALPFLYGVGWSIWSARQRPATFALLLWTAVMLLPTMLAEDTPHFLRAVGILPAALFFPALGLDRLLAFVERRYSQRLILSIAHYGLLPLLLLGSLAITIRDYSRYAQAAETGYLFEAAARTLAEEINETGTETAVFLDERFYEGWPSVQFLVKRPLTSFTPADGLPTTPSLPAHIYAWPYGPLDFLEQAFVPPVLVYSQPGPLARGDLEPEAYSLYTQYRVNTTSTGQPLAINFEQTLWLRQAQAVQEGDQLLVELVWEGETTVSPHLIAFVHLIGPDGGVVSQLDAPPGQGHWSSDWWQPGRLLHEQRRLPIPQPEQYQSDQYQIHIGLYDAQSGQRLHRTDTGTDFYHLP